MIGRRKWCVRVVEKLLFLHDFFLLHLGTCYSAFHAGRNFSFIITQLPLAEISVQTRSWNKTWNAKIAFALLRSIRNYFSQSSFEASIDGRIKDKEREQKVNREMRLCVGGMRVSTPDTRGKISPTLPDWRKLERQMFTRVVIIACVCIFFQKDCTIFRVSKDLRFERTGQ